MAGFLARRIAHAALALFLVLVLVFIAGRMIGDPAILLLGPEARPEDILRVRTQMGLEAPLWEQFARFMSGAVRADFGVTFRYGFSVPDVKSAAATGTPVLPLVMERLPATYLLAAAAMLIACTLAVLLGCVAAMSPRSGLDRTIGVVSLAGVSVVDFWLGFILIMFFSLQLGWLPTSGAGTAAHLVLPALTLAVRPIGRITQLVRSAMLDELAKPYVDALRSKGFSEPRIVFGHALKNASIPTATMFGDELLQIVQGAIVVEVVFAWPGVGSLLVTALSSRDLPLVEAAVFVLAVTAITVNLLVDLAYTRLDPRVRFAQP